MTESEKNICVDHAEHREDQHFMVQTPRTSHGNYLWPFCYRHGKSKCAKCEQYGNEWTEQEEVIRNFNTTVAPGPMQNHVSYKHGQESRQAARDV